MSIVSVLKTITEKLNIAKTGIVDELKQLRNNITTKAQELQRAIDTPVPAEEVLRATIPAVVREAGAYWIKEHGTSLIYGSKTLAAPNPNGSRDLPWSLSAPVPWAALCAADPAFAEKLLGGLVKKVAYESGPPSSERPKLIARLTAELAELEAAEEAFVDDACAAGVTIAHRPETIQRRESEAERRKLEESSATYRANREASLAAAKAAAEGTPRVGRSHYLETGRLDS